MSTFGRIEEFQPGRSVWKEYYERLDFFFTANDIEEDVKKRAVFLSVCGPSLYSIIRSLSTPASPSTIDFGDIILKLNAHFAPTPSEILSRFHFHKRDQRPQESISDFLAEIRRLSEHCNFGNQLDSMLRDRLVCGLRDEHIQRRLLANAKLTLQTATDEALSGEAATRHAQEIRGSTSEVLHLKNSKNSNSRFSKKEHNSKEKKKNCFRCGEIHPFGECKFINATCYFCHKVGHISKVCNAKGKTKVTDSSKKKINNTRVANVETKPQNFENSAYQTFHHVNCLRTVDDAPPNDITVKLNGLHHTMEIDNGSLHSIIGTSNFAKLWPVNPPELLPVSRQLLRTWSSEKLDVKGYFDVDVSYNKVNAKLPLVVVQGNGKSLIGRSWFDTLGIKVIIEDASPVNLIREKSIDKLIGKYKRVFSVELGTFKGPPLTIKVDDKQAPVFFRARTVPFALRDRVSKELENMINKGILESVTYSDWATPIVPVIKKDGSIRVCGDYRCTINQAVKQFTYPLPTVNEVLATVSGGTVFSKLDLSEAYLQLPVDEPTSRLLTLNTHKGLFRVKRLPFGVSVAVAIFQKRMEEVLSGIDGVLPYLDDIFISGKDIESHKLKLQQVLERLDHEGIRLRKEKCKFAVPEIILLGFRVNANGIQPTADKVAAIHQAPTPSNVTELQAFLGLLNFYGCFLKNRSDVLQPLHQLLQKDAKWCWTVEHDRAYKAAKELLQRDDLLVHYDEKRPLILTCDASSYGLGAVLSHELQDGSEAPIAYYSRTMMKAEKNYSQTDKEALAIVAAVKKFHSYLFGRKFKIITDHKPLLGLLSPTKPIPQMVSPRVLRWSLCLQSYDYELEYRQGKQISNADALSRLPVSTPEFEVPTPSDVLLLEIDPELQIDSNLLASTTKKDPILSRVSLWILNGWPNKVPDDRFQPYFRRRNELSVHQDCILWGSRVIVPENLRQEVLRLLHGSHPGIVRMKGLARSYVWWPNMDSQIESTVNACQSCQEFQRAPPRAPIYPWERTEKPWSRLHIDFAGPYHGQTFFLVVDSHSKWLEVLHVSSMSSATAIAKLRSLFATHGLPDTICSDNGSAFDSEEFKTFLKKNQIRQILVAPYHPSSNGQAERMVATTKESLKRIIRGTWQARLARFLFSQHTLPCTATGKSPSELLMNRRLTSILDRLHPDLNKAMQKKVDLAQFQKRARVFSPSDPVYIRNYSTGSPWSPAVILESTGPLSYRAQTPDGHITRRHVDQIRGRTVPTSETPVRSPDPPESPETVPEPDSDPEPTVVNPTPDSAEPLVPVVTSSPGHPPTPRRSQRSTCRPKYLQDYVHSTTGGVLCLDVFNDCRGAEQLNPP